jgi:hypothetical protein
MNKLHLKLPRSRHKDRFVSKRMSRYSSYDKVVRNSGIGGGARNDSAASFLARSATLSKPNGSWACRDVERIVVKATTRSLAACKPDPARYQPLSLANEARQPAHRLV